MPEEFNISKWPRWALIGAAGIGITLSGAIGTWIGVKVYDHEIRLTRVESLDIKEDLRGIKLQLSDLQRQVDRLPK